MCFASFERKVLAQLVILVNQGKFIMEELEMLAAAFDRHDAEVSVVIQEMHVYADKAAVKGADPEVSAKIKAFADRLDASTAVLAGAVDEVAPVELPTDAPAPVEAPVEPTSAADVPTEVAPDAPAAA